MLAWFCFLSNLWLGGYLGWKHVKASDAIPLMIMYATLTTLAQKIAHG